MSNEIEILELAKAIHALTESLAESFKIQAETCKVLSRALPDYSKEFQVVASGAQSCASNLLQNLPPLPEV